MNRKILIAKIALIAALTLGALPAQAATPVTASVKQICQEARSNAIRATELYAKRSLSVAGKVLDARKTAMFSYAGVKDSYSASIELGNAIRVSATTHDQAAISSLSKGQTISASGTIRDISIYRSSGVCLIQIENSKFQTTGKNP